MKKIFLLIIAITMISCVSNKKKTLQQNILTLRDSYCKAPLQYNYSQKLPSYNSDSIILANSHLKNYFSDQVF